MNCFQLSCRTMDAQLDPPNDTHPPAPPCAIVLCVAVECTRVCRVWVCMGWSFTAPAHAPSSIAVLGIAGPYGLTYYIIIRVRVLHTLN